MKLLWTALTCLSAVTLAYICADIVYEYLNPYISKALAKDILSITWLSMMLFLYIIQKDDDVEE